MSNDFWSRLGAPQPFDPTCKFVTSPVLPPLALALLRLTLAIYTLVTLLISLIWDDVVRHEGSRFLTYFTNLSYIGICAYFWASGVQTLHFALSRNKLAYPLQRWPRCFQFLHTFLWTTITTFACIVSPIFWGLLAGPGTLKTHYDLWSNVSVHAFNLGFALFEIFFTYVGPQPWLHVPCFILVLGGYLGVAYITHATQGFYTYAFLNPTKQHAFLAVYVIGIPLLGLLSFSIIWFICWVKMRLIGTLGPKGKRDLPMVAAGNLISE